MIKKYLQYINESNSNEIVLTGKRNPKLIINIIIESGEILDIINRTNQRFPFQKGNLFNIHALNNWACNNNFTLNDKDTCPEKKVFGIKTSDIPKGHELRMLYPSKFKK